MSVSEWRFCGRFNDWTQNAVPETALTWIDEDEARRRPLPRAMRAHLTVQPGATPQAPRS